ncbi:MAG: MoaD/ThiS family protein [bacterium]|nr:MoaD/ThiS family protein [bacterium]
MRIRLRFFASLRERLGPGDDRAVAPGSTPASLWASVIAEHPDLRRTRVRFAVNERYVEPSERLADGDELAVFPPVSGGA